MSPFGIVSRIHTLVLHSSPPSLCISRPLFRVLKSNQVLLREVVPDGITGPETNPLRDGSVLLLCSGELDFCAEGLVALQMIVLVL
jgi:hypothetical protein